MQLKEGKKPSWTVFVAPYFTTTSCEMRSRSLKKKQPKKVQWPLINRCLCLRDCSTLYFGGSVWRVLLYETDLSMERHHHRQRCFPLNQARRSVDVSTSGFIFVQFQFLGLPLPFRNMFFSIP